MKPTRMPEDVPDTGVKFLDKIIRQRDHILTGNIISNILHGNCIRAHSNTGTSSVHPLEPGAGRKFDIGQFQSQGYRIPIAIASWLNENPETPVILYVVRRGTSNGRKQVYGWILGGYGPTYPIIRKVYANYGRIATTVVDEVAEQLTGDRTCLIPGVLWGPDEEDTVRKRFAYDPEVLAIALERWKKYHEEHAAVAK